MTKRSALLTFSLPFLAGVGVTWMAGIDRGSIHPTAGHHASEERTKDSAEIFPGAYLPLTVIPASGGNLVATFDRIRTLRDQGGRLDLALANLLIAGAASRDPSQVLKFLLEPESEILRRSCLPTLLNVWVAADSQGAIDGILSLKKGADRTELEFRLLSALAEQAPEQALKILEKNGRPVEGYNFNTVSLYYQTFLNWSIRDPREAEARLAEIQDPARREQALQGLATARARSGFRDALAWLAGSSLVEENRSEVRNIIYQEGLRIDGPGAMDELGALMKTNNGADGLLIFRQNQQALIGQDPKRALELLLSQPARDKEFRSALEIFFHQMAISRPVDAREIIGGFLGDPARMAEIHAGNIPFSEGKTNSIAGSLAYASAMVDDAKGFEALSSGGLAMQSVDAVMRKLMAVDPGRVASIYQEKGLPKLQTFINEWSTTDPAAATAWVENHVSDPGWRAEIKSSVENADAPRNPRVYADVLLDRDDTPANRTLTASVAHGLAYTSPPAAAEWALRIRDPELFKAAVISISSLWLNEDSVQASEWISKLPAGAARDAAIRILVQAVDPMDPDSAKEWNKLLDKP